RSALRIAGKTSVAQADENFQAAVDASQHERGGRPVYIISVQRLRASGSREQGGGNGNCRATIPPDVSDSESREAVLASDRLAGAQGQPGWVWEEAQRGSQSA